MATSQYQLGAPIGDGVLIDTKKVDPDHKPDESDLSSTAFGYTKDFKALRTRLKAKDATLYTDDYLNSMTQNDMVYALDLTL